MVLDASVLAKLFVREPLSEHAHALVRAHSRFHAPALVRVEVSSAITRKVRRGELTAGQAEASLALWAEFRRLSHLRLDDDGDLLPAAERLSLDLRHPLADCLYLAAAERHRVPLVTADRPFVDALAGRFPSVRHLDAAGP
ncbi:MAG: hypothetical protein C0501_21325 [Isosphaera sp.]|nr:hypothetical protein [Isosphaera sp.]